MRTIISCRIIGGLLVLTGSCSWGGPPLDTANSEAPPPQEVERQQADAAEAGSAERTVDSVVDPWTKRLEDTGFLHLVLRCSRRTFDATELNEIGEPIDEGGSYIIAESSMAPDSYVLMVWETDSNWKKKQSKPHLIMGFADGYAHERVWYESQQQYRTRVFEATNSLLGPLDSSYDGGGCQYGALLTTWVGATPDPRSVRENYNRAKPFARLIESPDPRHPDATVVRTQTPPMRENGKIVYDRWDDKFYNDGVMFLWTSTVYQGMQRPDNPYYIVQERSYEYEFRDAPSDREMAMIEHTRNRINEWIRDENDSD